MQNYTIRKIFFGGDVYLPTYICFFIILLLPLHRKQYFLHYGWKRYCSTGFNDWLNSVSTMGGLVRYLLFLQFYQ